MIALGCDHAGYELKLAVMRHLQEQNLPYLDLGCHSTQSVDYVDYAKAVGEMVIKGEAERGILICGTGIGIGIAANKMHGIRAALCHDVFSAKATRQHNDSNILTMGARVIGVGLALEIVDAWLGTGFLGGKHKARIDHLHELEQLNL